MKNLFCILVLSFVSYAAFAQQPDTLGGVDGWRYADADDAAFWHNVAVGDVLIFQGASTPNIIDSRQYEDDMPMVVQGGSKIHIWRGSYKRILLKGNDGVSVENSTIDSPVTITNLGGQVRWGENYDSQYRGFQVEYIDHLYITGQYSQEEGTGHEDYLGMFGDLTQPGWKYNFGMLGDQKFSSFNSPDKVHGLGFAIKSFLSVKVRGVAVIHGYFAGFNIKNDVGELDPLVIDVQYCLSGWHDGEGFYIGFNGSGTGSNLSENVTILKNNIALFTGAEGMQTDFMSEGSEIKNNFVFKTGCFYQTPFQGNGFQENGYQWSFTEAGVEVTDNIFFTANAGNILVGPRYKDPGEARRGPAGDVLFSNNLLGQARQAIGYIFQGDEAGAITYRLVNNVIDSITVDDTNDAYEPEARSGYFNVGNSNNPIHFDDNIYPPGRSLFEIGTGTGENIVSTEGAVAMKAPYLRMHENFGFDPKEILTFKGVWLTGSYNDNVQTTGPIPYDEGDMVYKLTGVHPVYYRCIASHDQVRDPETSADFWEKLTWDGNDEPAYSPLIQANNYYNHRGMGLEFNPTPSGEADFEPPVISLVNLPEMVVGDPLLLPEVTVDDNADSNPDLSGYFPTGRPDMNEIDRITSPGYVTVEFNADDEAGNRAEPLRLTYEISECVIESTVNSQLNFHRTSPIDLTTPEDYWTDLAGADGLENGARTFSALSSDDGSDLSWTVTIDDGAAGFYSRHYATYDEASPVAIGSFPADVLKEGLRLREGIENKCHIIFNNMDPDMYYDFEFAGYRTGDGEINISLTDSLSGQSVSFDVIGSDQSYSLTNISPASNGKISIIYQLTSASGYGGSAQSTLGGMIIKEKTGFGTVGEHCFGPSNLAVENTSIEENNAPGAVITTITSDAKPESIYSIAETDDFANFSIQGDQLIINNTADYEFKTSYDITIVAENPDGSIQLPVTVEIIDVVNETLSIEEKEVEIVLAPNPTERYFEIKSSIRPIYSLELYTLLGQRVLRQSDKFGISRIDVSHLPNGVYIMKAEGFQSIKVFVQH